jgi:AhpD family alkylhydroperoxidase
MFDQDEDAATPLKPRVAAAIVDVLVYVVVLNLFVENSPQVLTETFTLSLLTAVLLKGALEVVVAAKNWSRHVAVEGSTLPAATQELVKIRASQINGCGFCTDMHTKDAAQAGETSGAGQRR